MIICFQRAKSFAYCSPGVALGGQLRRRPNAFNILHQLEFLERTGLGRELTVKTLEVGWGSWDVHMKPINRWNNKPINLKWKAMNHCCISSMNLEKSQFSFRCLRPMKRLLPSHQPIPWGTRSPGQRWICSVTSHPWWKRAWSNWCGYPSKFDHCSRDDTYFV